MISFSTPISRVRLVGIVEGISDGIGVSGIINGMALGTSVGTADREGISVGKGTAGSVVPLSGKKNCNLRRLFPHPIPLLHKKSMAGDGIRQFSINKLVNSGSKSCKFF